ncbi:MAG: hypothetical protein AAF683_04090 [Pseudomonadota bacterium]
MTRRRVPRIQPSAVTLDRAGNRTRSFFVVLPAGMVADDLKEPSIWVQVQASRATSLVPHDRLYMVAQDSSFAMEARVTAASGSEAVLHLSKLITMSPPTTALFEDDDYKVAYGVNGYAVIRKADGQLMGDNFANEGLAVRHLVNLRPVHV